MDIFKHKFLKIFLLIFALVTFFTLVAFITYGQPRYGTDDANITFIYAKNFAEGHGFVYNVGGERVEGFSSMLWALITSIFFGISTSPEILILIFNVIVLTLSITYFIHYEISSVDGRFKRTLLSGLFLIWIFALPNFIVWGTITLMEFGLYSAILLSIVTVLLKVFDQNDTKFDRRLLYALLPALILVRPESLAWTPLFLGFYLYAKVTILRSVRNGIRVTLFPAILTITTLILLISFRLNYFGYPFPNTYYAKVSTDFLYNLKQGFYYLRDFIDANHGVFFLLLLAVACLLFLGSKLFVNLVRKRWLLSKEETKLFFGSACALVGVAIPVVTGGDHFNQFRFMQPVWPLLILPLIFQLDVLKLTFHAINFSRIHSLILALTFVFTIFYFANNVQWHNYKATREENIVSLFEIYQERELGSELTSIFATLDELPTIGVLPAGAIKMTYAGFVNDLLGLNNVEMAHATGEKTGLKAHAAFNKEVFYKQMPDMLSIKRVNNLELPANLATISAEDFSRKALKNIYDDDRFKELYTKAVVSIEEQDFYLFGFFKRDFLEELQANNFSVHNYPY